VSAAYVMAFIPPARVGRKPSPEVLFYALLLKAQREGRLDAEADLIGIERAYAAAMLRRLPLFNKHLRDRVERVIEVNLAEKHMVDVWRPLGAMYRFHL
jgi:hypothetical protein